MREIKAWLSDSKVGYNRLVCIEWSVCVECNVVITVLCL